MAVPIQPTIVVSIFFAIPSFPADPRAQKPEECKASGHWTISNALASKKTNRACPSSMTLALPRIRVQGSRFRAMLGDASWEIPGHGCSLFLLGKQEGAT